MVVLVRDGFFYYCVMLGTAILNLVVLRSLIASHNILSSGFTVLLRASFSITGSRIMLNMREVIVGADPRNGHSTTPSVNNILWAVRMKTLSRSDGRTEQTDED